MFVVHSKNAVSALALGLCTVDAGVPLHTECHHCAEEACQLTMHVLLPYTYLFMHQPGLGSWVHAFRTVLAEVIPCPVEGCGVVLLYCALLSDLS